MLEIRPCADDTDKEISLAIYNEVVPEEAVSLREVREFEAVQIETADFLAMLDGETVGAVAAGISHARPQTAQTFLTVLPEKRRQGIGSALYAEISAWARGRGATELQARIQEREQESIAFAERRGFRVLSRDTRLVLDLTDLAPAPVDPPQGIEIVRWADRPELARGLHEVTFEANPDVPGSEDWAGEPFEVWEEMHRPPLMFAAVAGDEVVGFAELFVTDARPGVATHMMIGVKREWRKQGIAGALKRAQIAWAKENGYEQMQTANELRNEPIRRLNEQLGYREAPGRVEVRGPLAASG
ncbi:MAG: GNAT family N-acetyltransferase [Actinobacteria bacterium]|nr:MAG: GNAT family N-acetyltransferase [Actinomycetota bacterium]